MVEIFKIKISAFWCILKWPARWGGRLAGRIRYMFLLIFGVNWGAALSGVSVEWWNTLEENDS
jgi:hypothetical protein